MAIDTIYSTTPGATQVPVTSYGTSCQGVQVGSPWTVVRPVFKTTMVGGPPVFDVQPQGLELPAGGTAVFTVAVSGFQPITLQWRKDGIALAGETGTTLTITNVDSNDAGTYDCVATNTAGVTTSNPVELITEGQALFAIYLGNAGINSFPAYTPNQIKALKQSLPQVNPVLRGEFDGSYEISAPESGQNEFRIIATPEWFVDGTPVFRSAGAVLPMELVQDDLVIDGSMYRVYRTISRSSGDFTTAGNTAISVIVT
jgi:hypothetical protein